MKLVAKKEMRMDVGSYSNVVRIIKEGEVLECINTEDGIKVDFGSGNLVSPYDFYELKEHFEVLD